MIRYDHACIHSVSCVGSGAQELVRINGNVALLLVQDNCILVYSDTHSLCTRHHHLVLFTQQLIHCRSMYTLFLHPEIYINGSSSCVLGGKENERPWFSKVGNDVNKDMLTWVG